MTDRLTPEQRHRVMSRIHGKGTKPELKVRQWLWRHGYRYRLNVKSVPGKPDIVMRRYRTAIFVNGCFWHRHKHCKYAYVPKSNIEFWFKKFDDNVKRDDEVKKVLEDQEIKQLIIWECTVRKMEKNVDYRCEILNSIESFLLGEKRYFEI